MKKALLVLIAAGVAATAWYFITSGKGTAQPQRIYRVGILSGLEFFAEITDGFKQRMTKLGYVEGKNIFYDIQKPPFPVGNEKIIRKFVEDKVDLIFVFPTEASFEARSTTKGTGVPVVFGTALIEMPGIIDSIRQPGENITGVQYGGNDVTIKRLEILHELCPGVKRIWLPYLKGYPTVAPNLEALKPVAGLLNVTLLPQAYDGPKEFIADLKARDASGKIGFDAVMTIVEPLLPMPECRDAIKAFCKKRRIPLGGGGIPMTDEEYGALYSYAPDNIDQGTLAATLADKILKGAKPGSLPVVTPEGRLIISHKAIMALGLNPDEGLMSMAEKIIK